MFIFIYFYRINGLVFIDERDIIFITNEISVIFHHIAIFVQLDIDFYVGNVFIKYREKNGKGIVNRF